MDARACLKAYYENYDEDGRLTATRHGQVEYLTTIKYLREMLPKGVRVLEIGAGTGRYSLTLAREGYTVHAVELMEHNLEILRAHIRPGDDIVAEQGDALDLSRFPDGGFDAALVLGPLYHLYTEQDRLRALQEARRVTKRGGLVFAAYCMNEATILQHAFQRGHLKECLAAGKITEDFHCLSEPEDLFVLFRVEDIDRLNAAAGLERVKFIATDGATNYFREMVDAMDDETFDLWMRYHLTVCERPELIGASHHTLDITRT